MICVFSVVRNSVSPFTQPIHLLGVSVNKGGVEFDTSDFHCYAAVKVVKVTKEEVEKVNLNTGSVMDQFNLH